jgi:hypothetical protein
MSVPNKGPDLPDPVDHDGTEDARRGNPASAYEEGVTGVIETATTRATTVSRRFGGARYALRRENPAPGDADEPDVEGAPGSEDQDT